MGQVFSHPVPPNAITGPMPVITNQPATSWKYLYRVLLEHGREYRFENDLIGSFPITGGSCGSFTIDGTANTSVYDGNGHLIFHDSLRRGIVTIQDNPGVDTGSSVILCWKWCGRGLQARYRPPICVPLPIEIRGGPGKLIKLREGRREFMITGSGAELEYKGWGKVTVNGDLQSLKHEGRGEVHVRGSVLGNLTTSYNPSDEESNSPFGGVTIEGDVGGKIVQNGVVTSVLVKGVHHGIHELPSKLCVVNGLPGAVVKIGGKRYVEVEGDEEEAPSAKRPKTEEEPGSSRDNGAHTRDGLKVETVRGPLDAMDVEEDEDTLYDA